MDRSSHKKCSIKKLFLKILQSYRENICVGVSFNKVAGLQARSYSSAVAEKPNKGGIAFKLVTDFIIRPF